MNKIIIVDDSPEDFEALSRAFKKTGCQSQIIYIDNGYDAVDAIKLNQPSLVLLDLNMPEMDGIELLKLIKEDKQTAITPTVIFSTSVNERDIDNCYRYGANAYIRKPLNFEEYLEIASIIDGFWIKTNIMSNST